MSLNEVEKALANYFSFLFTLLTRSCLTGRVVVLQELEKTTSSTEAPSCSSAACCSSSGAASVEDPSTIEGPAATTTTVVEETGESNETQMPSALELEKKLVVDLEDYKGLKCGFNFTEELVFSVSTYAVSRSLLVIF